MMAGLRNWKWTRRKLLRVFGIAGGSLVVGSACSEDAPKAPQPAGDLLLRRALRKHFHYLKIDEDVIAAFAHDLTQNQGAWRPATSPRPYTRFLASTDFFQNGADESRPLRYVRYYDPYLSACYNPFAAVDTPLTTARSPVESAARAPETPPSSAPVGRPRSA
ncbi:MAG: hypothetical protein GY944_28145 [bacterium]|nr:hypothetical protein [bacterium]MCP5044917.1 hypothetical protein [bacterium]